MAEQFFQWQPLREYCVELFAKCGMPREEAFYVADSLVAANLTGIDSHGVSRMPVYIERLEAGLTQKKASFEVLKDFPATMLVDAKNSMGAVVSVQIMQAAIEKAKTNGAVLVSIKNSNHFGMASYFARLALQENFIGYASTNAPSTMAPYGGIDPYFGTNPIACAVPSRSIPIVMDMASSVVARGKIILAERNGHDIPKGWAITKDGRPTVNAQEALDGTVLPFAGPKGYAIAMMVDIFSGILAGGPFGPGIQDLYQNPDTAQQVGHFFAVINPGCFTGQDEFLDGVEEMIRQIKRSPKAAGVEEIFLPGEIESRTRELREAQGIPLSPNVIKDLQSLGDRLGTPFVLPIKP